MQREYFTLFCKCLLLKQKLLGDSVFLDPYTYFHLFENMLSTNHTSGTRYQMGKDVVYLTRRSAKLELAECTLG